MTKITFEGVGHDLQVRVNGESEKIFSALIIGTARVLAALTAGEDGAIPEEAVVAFCMCFLQEAAKHHQRSCTTVDLSPFGGMK